MTNCHIVRTNLTGVTNFMIFAASNAEKLS